MYGVPKTAGREFLELHSDLPVGQGRNYLKYERPVKRHTSEIRYSHITYNTDDRDTVSHHINTDDRDTVSHHIIILMTGTQS